MYVVTEFADGHLEWRGFSSKQFADVLAYSRAQRRLYPDAVVWRSSMRALWREVCQRPTFPAPHVPDYQI